MRGLDETDEKILSHILEDGRKPYSEIADAVGLSAPAVSDRIDRLREIGLLERFTVELNQEMLQTGQSFLLTVDGTPGSGQTIANRLEEHGDTEHVFRTIDDTVVSTVVSDTERIGQLLSETLPAELVREYDVQLLASSPTVVDGTVYVGSS
ncbi:MAG: Lrp/AsnC family transcriptional regulator, partial [Natronomonas sp.]